MDRLQLVPHLAGLGRSAGGPGRPHAAGRLSAAVGRADASPPPSARRAGDPPPRPGRTDAATAGVGRERLGGVSLVRGPAGRRARAGRSVAASGWARSMRRATSRRWDSAMARLPVSPRLARMLLEGQRLGQPEAVALAAALLGERDPFRRGEDGAGRIGCNLRRGRFRVRRVRSRGGPGGFRSVRARGFALGRMHRSTAQFVLHVRDQLLRELRQAEREDKRRTRPRSREERDGGRPRPSSHLRSPTSAETCPTRRCGAGCWRRFPIGWCGGAGPAAGLDGWSAAGACAWSNRVPSATRRCFWRWTSIAAGRRPWSPGLGGRARLAARPIGLPADRGRVRRGEPAA